MKFVYNNKEFELSHGSVVIAAITSCTNTSNPSVMLGAGKFIGSFLHSFEIWFLRAEEQVKRHLIEAAITDLLTVNPSLCFVVRPVEPGMLD